MFKLMTNNNLMRSLHRDLGYFFIGVTLIYSITGFILSVRGLGWFKEEYIFKTVISNNIKIENFQKVLLSEAKVGKLDSIYTPETAKVVERNIKRLVFTKKENNTLSFEYKTKIRIQYNISSGVVDVYYKAYPPYLEIFISSHLSTNNNIWFYLAMVYSLVLAFFAISGVFIVKGKYGFKKRGIYLTSIGILTVFIFIYLSFYTN